MATQRKWIERIAESLSRQVAETDVIDLIDGLDLDEEGRWIYEGKVLSVTEQQRIVLAREEMAQRLHVISTRVARAEDKRSN